MELFSKDADKDCVQGERDAKRLQQDADLPLPGDVCVVIRRAPRQDATPGDTEWAQEVVRAVQRASDANGSEWYKAGLGGIILLEQAAVWALMDEAGDTWKVGLEVVTAGYTFGAQGRDIVKGAEFRQWESGRDRLFPQ